MVARQDRSTTPLHVTSQAASTTPARQPATPNSVKARLTSKRSLGQVENDEYAAFIRRILRAYSRRVGDGDVEALALMLDLAKEIDTAIAETAKGLRAHGYSWAEIGARSRHYPPSRTTTVGMTSANSEPWHPQRPEPPP
jgi:hypothetical protein